MKSLDQFDRYNVQTVCFEVAAVEIPKDTAPQVSCPVETKPLVPLGLDISDPASELPKLSESSNENSDDISNPLATEPQVCCVMETVQDLLPMA